MHGLKHPFSGAVYEGDGDGHIVVTASDGRRGVFYRSGKWISGELRECDAQLCNWIGGPRMANHRLASQQRRAD